MQCIWSVQCTIAAGLSKLHQPSLLHSSYYCIEMQEQPDVGSNEKLLKKWKGSKLVKGSEWDELRSSVCLIDCEDGTGTGFIGEKCGNLYLVTCWHNFEENDEETFLAKDILKTARKCKLHFSYTIKKDRPEWCMRGSDLLLNKRPIGKKVCVK